MKNVHHAVVSRPWFGRSFPRIGRTLAASCVLAACLLQAMPVSAEPVRIVTSGGLGQIPFDGETSAAFLGDGFAILDAEVNFWRGESCWPCTPGSLLDLSAVVGINNYPPGTATIDGRVYESVYYEGLLDIDAGSIVVPNLPPDGPGMRPGPSTTFTFTGTLSGFADPSRTGTPLFTLLLAGGGTASMSFFHVPIDGLVADGFEYEFEAAAATPEPGSLLLFASGAALIGRRWRHRRR